MRQLTPFLPVASVVLVACANAPVPCPVTPAAVATPTPTPSTSTPTPTPTADLTVLLRPIPTPTPLVHVELDLQIRDAHDAPPIFHITRGSPDHLSNASAHDATGDLPVTVSSKADGVDLTLSRPPHGALLLAYDVLASGDAPDDPLGLIVLDDRFHGAGEDLIALPSPLADDFVSIVLRIDGDPLRATCASSFGVGNVRRMTMPARALRYGSYVAGSLGAMQIDDPATGHDEGAWLGYTAFDPRPAVAELAQLRTGLREYFKSGYESPWTHLFVSQTRPIGSFSTSPRAMSELVQVGPSEPWSAALRLSVAQQLVRKWLGQDVAIETPGGKSSEAWRFGEGVARYVAMHVTAQIGLMTPDEMRDAVAGELAVMATSPDRAMGNADLATLARTDGVARATLTARGALYALREAHAIRAHTKKQRDLEETLAEMVRGAQEDKKHIVSVSGWLGALAKDDPDAAATFDALVTKGGPIALPPDALGPCFRAGAGEYVAYDPGFDIDATRIANDSKIVGLRADGPAAKAGVRAGDVLDSLKSRDGDATTPVKLTVARDGKKIDLTYLPRGAHGRGQTWTRVKGIEDDWCGDAP